MKILQVIGVCAAFAVAVPVGAISPGNGSAARVSVASSRSSAFISIAIANDRKIGVILLEVRDAEGRTLYREEGKALTGELVRRLDKGVFPRGAHTLHVTARDFSITQPFAVE